MAPSAAALEAREHLKPGVEAQEKDLTASKKRDVRYPFWFGGSATSMAACVTHPLDLVKVRLQTRGPSAPRTMTATFIHVVRTGGFSALYSGISASLLRQMTYSTVRFGVYSDMKHRAAARANTSAADLGFPTLIATASASGFLGGVAGNPADVVNVRMQYDTALPPAQRRNYRNAVDGLVRLAREEGLASWFRGWMPNGLRAAATTASQIATYDFAKAVFVRRFGMSEDGWGTQTGASFVAGLTAATVTSPVDVVKTRVMARAGSEGLVGFLGRLFGEEGVRWMFKGWLPAFLRQGPHTMLIFFFLEMHHSAYRRMKGIGTQD